MSCYAWQTTTSNLSIHLQITYPGQGCGTSTIVKEKKKLKDIKFSKVTGTSIIFKHRHKIQLSDKLTDAISPMCVHRRYKKLLSEKVFHYLNKSDYSISTEFDKLYLLFSVRGAIEGITWRKKQWLIAVLLTFQYKRNGNSYWENINFCLTGTFFCVHNKYLFEPGHIQ